MKLVCRNELLTPKIVEDTKPAQDMVDITGHVVHENASYEKDVVEIKLPDTAVSSDYGGNFVKDVCIDEGHWKISEGKIVDEKSSPNFDCLMIDGNNDQRYGRKDDAKNSVHKLKPEIVLPVGFAPDGNNEKQYSSCKEYDLEGGSTATNFTGDLSENKISLEGLLRLEIAEESQRKGAISSGNSENHTPPLHGAAVGQVSINDCHGVESIASKTSEPVNISVPSKDHSNGWSAAMTSEERDAASAFDARRPIEVNHCNPFLGHESLEDSKPECSISIITDAASTEPVCTVEKTDSFSDKGFNEVETAEPKIDSPSSSSSDAQSSVKRNDQNESLASEAITDAVDETVVASSSSANSEELSGANGESHGHDFNQIDEDNCVDTMNDNTVSKSSTQVQKDNVCEQSVPDSANVTSRIGNGYLPYEPGLFGPSIMSAPVSNSGHIAYSGNISIRSDSSTTSARSFAFPVLQREWISSPVRMAKGERRRDRRRRGWRKGLLCCTF